MSEEKEHQHCAADTESANYVHIDNVVYHLDDIEVGEDGKCAWTDVANALTHIKLCREHIPDAPQTLSVEDVRQLAEIALRTFCKSMGDGAVQISSDGVERIYYAGLSLKALSVAVAMAVTRPKEK